MEGNVLGETLDTLSREVDSEFIDRICYVKNSTDRGFIGVKIKKNWYVYLAPSWVFASMCKKSVSVGTVYNRYLRPNKGIKI